MAIQSRISTGWLLGSYESDRNEEIKRHENDSLRVNGVGTGGEVVVRVPNPAGGLNITVGYGWDIDEQSLSATLTNFAAAGITLTANEQTVLEGYKSGSVVTFDIGSSTVTRQPTQGDVISVWGASRSPMRLRPIC
ncbi:MAG: hypothetical protein ACOZAA_04555 [Pseudomonadota bacterium]